MLTVLGETVIIDPRFRLPYHTYVLQGLSDAGFRLSFRRLDRPSGHGLALQVDDRRVWFDTDDMARIEAGPYEWCDVHAKVNVTKADFTEYKKVRPVGPAFGIRYWSLPRGYITVGSLVARGADPRATLAGMRFQGKTRLPIDSYPESDPQQGFVFHRSRAWSGKHMATNGARERFIEALGNVGLGGGATLASDRIPLAEYLERTSRSSVVFNSAAVHGCLGWKLGEYLTMGKAIVSTPVQRVLPAPLVHGSNIHFVDDTVEAIAEAVILIDRDAEYRAHLEAGARRWYEQYLAPAAMISRVLAS